MFTTQVQYQEKKANKKQGKRAMEKSKEEKNKRKKIAIFYKQAYIRINTYKIKS